MKFELGTMLFQLVAFVILMLLVSRFAMRPIQKMMKQRRDHIAEQIQSAEENRAKAEELLAKQESILQQTRQEAKEMIEQAKIQKNREAEAIIKQAKERADRMVQEAQAEIKLEKEKAIAELRDQVGLLGIELASKLLEQEINSKEQSKLVGRYIEEVGRVQ